MILTLVLTFDFDLSPHTQPLIHLACPAPPPALATDRVANLLLAYKGRSSSFAPGRAAEDIARQTARDVLGPLLDTACARLAHVLKRVVEASSDRALASGEEGLLSGGVCVCIRDPFQRTYDVPPHSSIRGARLSPSRTP